MATADERDTATHASPPEPDASSAEREIIIITGMSGAGRSEAMHTFEDLGYFCIDNLPPAFIGQLVALTALPGSRVHRVAVVCDVRGGSFFSELSQALDALSEEGIPTSWSSSRPTTARSCSGSKRHDAGIRCGRTVARAGHSDRARAASPVRGQGGLDHRHQQPAPR